MSGILPVYTFTKGWSVSSRPLHGIVAKPISIRCGDKSGRTTRRLTFGKGPVKRVGSPCLGVKPAYPGSWASPPSPQGVSRIRMHLGVNKIPKELLVVVSHTGCVYGRRGRLHEAVARP